jgi:hypothetical protein
VSKYLAYPQIIFKSRELLLGALAELGYTLVEQGEALPLNGYLGDRHLVGVPGATERRPW